MPDSHTLRFVDAVLPTVPASHPCVSPTTQESLDAQLAAVFGTADLTSGKSLSLTEFLQCLHEYHLQRIRARPTLRSMKKGGSGGEAAAVAQAVAAK